jgi:hypothetical protein
VFALGEVGEGGGFGFEGRNGVDKASDGEGVADAAWPTDEAEGAAFAGQLDGAADQSGDAGTVDLRHAVEIDHHFAGAAINDRLEGVVKLFAGFANGKAAVNVEDGDGAAIADINFHGGVIGHVASFQPRPNQVWEGAARPPVHYTMKERKGHKRLAGEDLVGGSEVQVLSVYHCEERGQTQPRGGAVGPSEFFAAMNQFYLYDKERGHAYNRALRAGRSGLRSI